MLKNVLIYIFFLAIIFPAAYNTCKHFDFSHSVDTKSYIKIAQGDFNVIVTHKYRVIVPLVAATIARGINYVQVSNWKRSDVTLWNLQFSFFIINTFLIALACFVLFQFLRSYDLSVFASLIGAIMFATSRWVNYSAGLPIVDSLYYLMVFSLLLGIRSNNLWLIAISLLLGPASKESFFIFVPLLIFSRPFKVIIPMTIVSILLYYSFRFFIDILYPESPANGLENAFGSFQTIYYSLGRIFSFKGIMELLLVFGWFNLIIFVLAVSQFKEFINNFKSMDWIVFYFLLMVLAHMVLSGDTDRMFCLSAPFWALILGKLIANKEAVILGKS